MKKEDFALDKKLDHIAFIMDGNGRWAKLRGLPRYLGHKEACERLGLILSLVRYYHIKYASFYAFSTDNWNRPQDEIDHLMDYLEEFFKRELPTLKELNTRILISGDITRLRPSTKKACEDAMKMTEENDGYYVNICLNYGGKDEIVRAAKLFAEDYKNNKVTLDSLTEDNFYQYLYLPSFPPVDCMIRTSGEERISNFMLYRLAYAELVFTEVKWPDFKEDAFVDCLKEFASRHRRFGGLRNA